LGADRIRAFSCDPNDRLFIEPTKEGFLKAPAGSGPRHLTFHPNRKFAYCIEELSGTISIYRYNQGTLEFMERASAHPELLTGGFESSDIQISPDGLFLYAANRGTENNVAIFAIMPNGVLMLRGYQPVNGVHPRSLAITPSGQFLVVTNVETSNAVVFKRDVKTGKLTKTDEELIRNVSCVKFRELDSSINNLKLKQQER